VFGAEQQRRDDTPDRPAMRMTPVSFDGYSGRSTGHGRRVEEHVNAASEQLGTAAPTTGLSERDREIIAFERQWWKYAGSKETAIRELFDMSATRYYQVLNALLDHPSALEHDPMLVKRLRRLRASRQRARSARRLGLEP
jgi:hypothetical protein